MIAISNLFEKQTHYEPFMTGTAKQIGGKGYPTGQYRVGTGPPGVMMAKQKADEALVASQKGTQLRDMRRRKNPTASERQQGAY